MGLDILGPANAVNSTTARPAETRIFGGADTFFKPCSSPSALDGTAVQAVFLNGVLQQLRRAIRGMGVAEDNSDDMLLKAIQAAQSGLVSEAALFANMPVHAFVGAAGTIAYSTGTGQIVVATGQSIIRRGIRAYAMDDIILANRTFNTSASKTYHLRWYAPGIGRATPAASWPAGRLYLEDLADGGYNPSSLAEANASFDSSYDNVLLARIVTNGANALTVTALINLPHLFADLSSFFDQSTPGMFSLSGNFALSCSHALGIGWARTPKWVAPIGWVAIGTASGAFLMNGYANQVSNLSLTRYSYSATVSTDLNEPAPTLNTYSSQLMIKAVA